MCLNELKQRPQSRDVTETESYASSPLIGDIKGCLVMTANINVVEKRL